MIDDLHLRKHKGHSANDAPRDHLPAPDFDRSLRVVKQQPVVGSTEVRAGKVERLIATAIAIQAQDAEEAKEVGFIARAMIWASMPHKEVDGAHYKRDNGLASITMLVNPDIGLPYGKLPRLIAAWLTREAKRTRSRELSLGRSQAEFARKLGLLTNGGKRGDIPRLKQQATKLFGTFITVTPHQGQGYQYENVALSDKGMLLWDPKRPHEQSLWQSKVILSEAFFRECMDHAVPFDLRVLHVLRSPLAIDLYLWLTWRMFILRRPVLIPWISLRFQFGAGYAPTAQGMAHFREAFHRCLHEVRTLYPSARVVPERDGLRLLPSPPHVSEIKLGLVRQDRQSASVAAAGDH